MDYALEDLYNILKMYKESLCALINQIDHNIQEIISNINVIYCRKELNEKKYKVSKDILKLIEHYVNIKLTIETASSDLISKYLASPQISKETENHFSIYNSNLENNCVGNQIVQSSITIEALDNRVANVSEVCGNSNLEEKTDIPKSAISHCQLVNNVNEITNYSSIEKKRDDISEQISNVFDINTSIIDIGEKGPKELNSAEKLLLQMIDRKQKEEERIKENLTKNSLYWITRNKSPIMKTKQTKVLEKKPHFEISDSVIEVGQVCTICHIQSIYQFYVRTDPSVFEAFDTCFNEQMNKQFTLTRSGFKTMQEAQSCLGNFCCAFQPNKKKWCRIQVLEWGEPQLLVQLVDYGDLFNCPYNNLKPISEFYTMLPKMAIRCHFKDFYCPNEENATDEFYDLCGVKDVTKFVIVKAIKDGNSFDVNLREINSSDSETLLTRLETIISNEETESQITDKFLEEEVNSFIDLPAQNQRVQILITSYLTTCHFYAHILEKRSKGSLFNDAFSKLKEKMNTNNIVENYESFDEVPKPGDLVLVKEGLEWCRGRYISSNDFEIEVFLVDFGFSRIKHLDKLRKIKSEFLEVPFQALECVLSNCQEQKNIDPTESRGFFDNCMYMKIFTGIVIKSGVPLQLKLYDENNLDLSFVLQQYCLGEHIDVNYIIDE